MTYAECERLLAVVRMEIRAQAKIWLLISY
jgi:hypothetical protein